MIAMRLSEVHRIMEEASVKQKSIKTYKKRQT